MQWLKKRKNVSLWQQEDQETAWHFGCQGGFLEGALIEDIDVLDGFNLRDIVE